MSFNSDKLEVLISGRNPSLSEQYNYLQPGVEGPISQTDCVKDLGILFEPNGRFNKHIDKVIKKVQQRSSWIFRSFSTNNIQFGRKMWKTYIQGTLDYGSQIWGPIKDSQLSRLESLQKSFFSRIKGLKDLDYWERLRELKLYSVQRRFDRYAVLYLWKVMEGQTENYGLEWASNDRRGRMISLPKVTPSNSLATQAREQSLTVRGGSIFNSLPADLRNCTGVTKETFKAKLDSFLEQIPDNPKVSGLHPAPLCQSSLRQSNKIQDWILYLNLGDRRTLEIPS